MSIVSDVEFEVGGLIMGLSNGLMIAAQIRRQQQEEARVQGWIDFTAAEAQSAGMLAELASARADGINANLAVVRRSARAAKTEAESLEDEVDELMNENLMLRKQVASLSAELSAYRRRTGMHAVR